MERLHRHTEQAPLEIFEKDTLALLTKKAVSINEQHSINLAPFIDHYGIDKVTADYREIAERLLSFQEKKLSDSEKMGLIFEAAFLDTGSTHHWFGEKSELQRASRYDDIKNGIDMIATLVSDRYGSRHFAIASDLTFGLVGASEKYRKILTGIKKGHMGRMRYFHSDLLHITGELRNIPKTVTGLDVNNLNVFLKQWLTEPELAQKQFGALMLQQIANQSKAFSFVAKATHGENHHITEAYKQTNAVVREVLETEYTNIESPEDRLTQSIFAHSAKLIEEYK